MKREYFTREEAVCCVKEGVLRIPDNKTFLAPDFAFFVVRGDLPKVHTLIIPASLTTDFGMRGDPSRGPYGYSNNPFSEIIVEKDNPRYASKDGILFTKNMDTLLCYPCGKPGKVYHVPEEVKVIESESFLNVEHLENIYFTDHVNIKEHAFCACNNLHFPDIITIYQNGHRYMIVISDGKYYQTMAGKGCRYYKYDESVDILEGPVQKADANDLRVFLETGGISVKEHEIRCDVMYKFVDAGIWGHNDWDYFASDFERFVNTFYSEY